MKSNNNAQYIDSIIAYDREVQRISHSLRCNLDLGQISLLRAQLQNRARPQMHITSMPGQYSKSPQIDVAKSIIGLDIYSIYEGQKDIKDEIPQLDGTYNKKDNSNSDSQEYLDLADDPSRKYNTRANEKKGKCKMRKY